MSSVLKSSSVHSPRSTADSDKVLLAARGLHKSYNSGKKKLHVIKGIDISLKKGEMLFIVGPSGAGKSTLLHMLAGLDRPDEGQVVVDGTDIYSLPDNGLSRLRNGKIGFVFQFYHLLSEFSAIENVMLPALIQRQPVADIREKAASLLEKVGLGERLDNRPSELSGGEQQRAAIARALINSPDVLFCDEPTGNLDSKTGSLIYGLLFELKRKEGLAVMVVTHQRDGSGQADRCLTIKDGILQNNMV